MNNCHPPVSGTGIRQQVACVQPVSWLLPSLPAGPALALSRQSWHTTTVTWVQGGVNVGRQSEVSGAPFWVSSSSPAVPRFACSCRLSLFGWDPHQTCSLAALFGDSNCDPCQQSLSVKLNNKFKPKASFPSCGLKG